MCLFQDAPIISCYTRAQAIDDGTLVAVPEKIAREAGFKFPIAMTSTVFGRCVEVPEGVACQDESGRLWDVLWMLRCAIRGAGSIDRIPFAVHVRNDNRDRTPPLVKLVAHCGPGDDAEPVITIMFPGED